MRPLPGDAGVALAGSAIIGAGAVLAVALTPIDYAPQGAMFLPAAALAASLLAIPLMRGLAEGLHGLLHAENLLLVAIIYWILLDLLQGAYPLDELGRDDVIAALETIAVFALFIPLGRLIPTIGAPRPIARAARADLPAQNAFIAVCLCFALCISSYGIPARFDPARMIDGLFQPRFSAPWSRGDLGGWDAFIDHLAYFGYVLPAATVLVATRAKARWADPRVWISVLLTAIVCAFIAQSGGRRIIGMMLGSGLLLWMILKERFSIVRAAVVAGGAVGVLSLLQFILLIRNVGLEGFLSGDVGLEDFEFAGQFHVDDNFLRLAQIIHYFPDVVEYVGWKQIYYVLVRPIPRALWPDKPIDAGFSLPGLVGKSDVSLSSSIIGELYASYGLAAVILGALLLGWAAASWTALLRERNENARVLYCLGLMVFFVGMRSMQEIILMTYAVLAWTVVSLVTSKKSSGQSGATTPPARDDSEQKCEPSSS
ncbi:hypothetical protein A1351_11210 [Methylosinus sp. R-45379]|uniref:O-antigen polymerase n=1 Tax=Methylosinus sp. R-45379 TaxID=980563 RepID=UPI0007C97B50|nr:O-antigen polymerase [Methylosinus sp. R-45379]OAI28667.1 hypothetical protein A1351_11210 [Methylosinus sp. R-45379]